VAEPPWLDGVPPVPPDVEARPTLAEPPLGAPAPAELPPTGG
jgi:hypothetical protein